MPRLRRATKSDTTSSTLAESIIRSMVLRSIIFLLFFCCRIVRASSRNLSYFVSFVCCFCLVSVAKLKKNARFWNFPHIFINEEKFFRDDFYIVKLCFLCECKNVFKKLKIFFSFKCLMFSTMSKMPKKSLKKSCEKVL